MKRIAMVLMAALGTCLTGAAAAQAYPTHAVTLIVPSGAGGAADIVARIRAGGYSTHPVQTCAEGIDTLTEMLAPGDAVLLLTSGNLGGLIEAIPRLAEEMFPLAATRAA